MILNLTIYRIILAIIALVFFFDSALKFIKKEKNQTYFKFFSALMVWGSILIFSIFPKLSHYISIQMGLGENLNTLIFIGFVAVFMIIFKIIRIIEKIERNISEIIRNEALKNVSKNKIK
jgi:hypothetical protein